MENDPAAPDPPRQIPPAPTRDPLIRYSVFAALGCAALCMVFTILYIFSYSLDSTLSFERHFDSYASANTANLSTVLGLHMAQNRMFLQSCGMVAGIFFAFLGLALFLVGIQGTFDADGQVKDYSGSIKRLAPGGIILLASMIFVGVSAMHPVDFILAPAATVLAPTAATAPSAPTEPAPAANQTPSPTATAPSTQSQLPPAPTTAPTAHLTPQSAQIPSQAKPLTTAQPATQSPAQPIPATSPAQHPPTRLALVRIKQPATPPSTQHRFQP